MNVFKLKKTASGPFNAALTYKNTQSADYMNWILQSISLQTVLVLSHTHTHTHTHLFFRGSSLNLSCVKTCVNSDVFISSRLWSFLKPNQWVLSPKPVQTQTGSGNILLKYLKRKNPVKSHKTVINIRETQTDWAHQELAEVRKATSCKTTAVQQKHKRSGSPETCHTS